ncbi:MAG: methyltransferase domain-containing protein [Candidatus Uhrbacteria bacterium]|nr:methyltransferase domain-containing protein [Candidatus Uhrbacteria bacterium]
MKYKHEASVVYRNYMRIAKKIHKSLVAAGQTFDARILDWGGLDGVLANILFELGYKNITVYEFNKTCLFDFERFPNLRHVTYITNDEAVRLPFETESFDVVVSCGVLEHVAFIQQSVVELNRVLRYGAHFFVFHFPQKTSWTEFVVSHLSGSGHTRKYSARELVLVLQNNGFGIKQFWKFNLFPKTFHGLPDGIFRLYSLFSKPIYAMDGILSKIPVLNLLCNSLECWCKKVRHHN